MKTPTKIVNARNLGKLSYAESWALQEEIFQQIIQQKRTNRSAENPTATQNHLLFVEHPPVFTLGKSGDLKHLLVSEEQLKSKGIEFFKTNRGGDITFHGPGQLVGYPLLDLDHFFTDIHKYLRLLEEAVILTLADYGIQASRSAGETGVWLAVGTPFARKICAMGIRASRWVTMHGWALNVNTDLNYFDAIIPCGIQGKGVTSMAKELGQELPIDEVQERWIGHFENLFQARVEW
ncbi:MAG: lipoyl(octanoyl) transferase LipB [Flavobacteriaceae bacterium]